MQVKKENRILLTGGHAATTAIAVVEELKESLGRSGNLKIFWIGAKKAVEGKDAKTLESVVLPKYGVHCHNIIAGRLQRTFTPWTIPSIIKVPIGILQSFVLLLRIRPKVILSFGGYAAYPVTLAGFLMRIPVIVHEQTSEVGRANMMSAPLAKKIAISFKNSAKYFPKKKTVFTGNPVMKNIKSVKVKKQISGRPTILVVGGSRGSQKVNRIVAEALPNLLDEFSVIHLVGNIDYQDYVQLKGKLKAGRARKYQVISQVNPASIHKLYSKADIIISRAGANTISELMIVKRPSLLIPLPFSYKNEQRKNALIAEKYGVGIVLNQANLTSDVLNKKVLYLKNNWKNLVDQVAGKKSKGLTAAKEICELVSSYL